MKLRRCTHVLVLCLLSLAGCSKDKSANPGEPPGNPPPGGTNGKIAFVSRRDATAGINDDDLYLMNPDGSTILRLTNLQADLGSTCVSANGSWIAFDNVSAGEIDVIHSDGTGLAGIAQGSGASWSPDGARIAFWRTVSSVQQIFVVSSNGTGETPVATGGGVAPAWSPDGSRIAFLTRGAGGPLGRIGLIHPDGTGATVVSDTLISNDRPDWKPDGSLLVFVRAIPQVSGYLRVLSTIRPDGTGLVSVPNIPSGWSITRPSWSPDGSSLAFAKYVSGSYDLYVVKADGTGLTNISNAGGVDSDPDWGP